MARLEKCLIDNMMPFRKYYKCYPLFVKGPCNDGEWFVLNNASNDTLPNAHCEKALDCDGFTLKSDFAGKQILCTNFLITYYISFLKYPFNPLNA